MEQYHITSFSAQNSTLPCDYSYSGVEIPGTIPSRDVNNYSEVEALSAFDPYNATNFDNNVEKPCDSVCYNPEGYSPFDFSETTGAYNTTNFGVDQKMPCDNTLKHTPDSYSPLNFHEAKGAYSTTKMDTRPMKMSKDTPVDYSPLKFPGSKDLYHAVDFSKKKKKNGNRRENAGPLQQGIKLYATVDISKKKKKRSQTKHMDPSLQ